MKNLTLNTFKLKYTKAVGKQGHERTKKNTKYRRTFGNMPVVQAYAQYKAEHDARMAKYDELEKKISNFEKYLISQNARFTQRAIRAKAATIIITAKNIALVRMFTQQAQ